MEWKRGVSQSGSVASVEERGMGRSRISDKRAGGGGGGGV